MVKLLHIKYYANRLIEQHDKENDDNFFIQSVLTVYIYVEKCT